MKTPTKRKPSEMSSDLRQMVDLRHQAEQRGHYEPLWRLLYLKTPHGNIHWPVENGEAIGPDVALSSTDGERLYPRAFDAGCTEDDPLGTRPGEILRKVNILLLLGPWLPLPPVRVNSSTPCPKCRGLCVNCHGKGKKQCEQVGCGGLGHVEVQGQLTCAAPECSGWC